MVFGSCGIQMPTKDASPMFDELENSILVQTANPAFPVPGIPASITNAQERAVYLSKHYWEKFDFLDTSLISKTEISEQGFVDYIHILNFISFKEARRSIRIMLYHAQVNPTMYAHFASLFEKYYYDANSPYRNEELYIPVLEILLQSGILLSEDQEKYDFQQEMIHKNRVGTKAADFIYTLANGDWKRMHALKSNYLILFFTNPECPKCDVFTEELNNSEPLRGVFSHNSYNRSMLSILSIYPDKNVAQWRKALPTMPKKNWINAYDDGVLITKKRVYDIKAIPTIYLLDKNKRIILKDTSLEEIESFFIAKQ